MFWFQDLILIIFYIVNKQKNTKNAKIAVLPVVAHFEANLGAFWSFKDP
jgi:hypothetical protein